MAFPLSAYDWAALCTVLLAAALTPYFAFRFLNKAPALWFCDYDEEPSAALLSGCRFSYRRTGLACTLVLCAGTAGCFLVYGVSLYSVLLCLIMVLFLLIALSDGKYSIIPDQFTAVQALLCLAAAVCDLFTGRFFITSWWSPIAGGACGFLLLWLFNMLCRLLYKKDGIGFGDVKLFGALGVLFGFPAVFAAVMFAVFTAFFHILFLLVTKKAKSGAYLPMGPYICIGSALFLLLRTPVYHGIRLYLRLLGI